MLSYPGENREQRKHNRWLNIVGAVAHWRLLRFAPLVVQEAEADKVQERPQAAECEIAEHIVFARLHRGHLLEQVLADDEGHRGEEADDANGDAIVTGVRIVVVQADVLAVLDAPALRRNAAERDDGEQLEQSREHCIN